MDSRKLRDALLQIGKLDPDGFTLYIDGGRRTRATDQLIALADKDELFYVSDKRDGDSAGDDGMLLIPGNPSGGAMILLPSEEEME